MDLRELANETMQRINSGYCNIDQIRPDAVEAIILHALETAAGESKKADWSYYLATPTELTSSLEATITDLRAQLEALTLCNTSLSGQLEQARKVINQCQNAIQKVAGINDESRLGWALQAIEQFNTTRQAGQKV